MSNLEILKLPYNVDRDVENIFTDSDWVISLLYSPNFKTILTSHELIEKVYLLDRLMPNVFSEGFSEKVTPIDRHEYIYQVINDLLIIGYLSISHDIISIADKGIRYME